MGICTRITAIKKQQQNAKHTPPPPIVFESIFIGQFGKVTLGTDASPKLESSLW